MAEVICVDYQAESWYGNFSKIFNIKFGADSQSCNVDVTNPIISNISIIYKPEISDYCRQYSQETFETAFCETQ